MFHIKLVPFSLSLSLSLSLSYLLDGSAPIFSVDVHPDGNRLASSGGDGTVVLWSVSHIFSKLRKKDKDLNLKGNGKSVPECEDFTEIDRVATLVDHRGKPVNVARFSNSGRFIASGGDNHLVLIHELRPSNGITTGGSFGSSVKNIENWVMCITLTGHSNNVVDLGWSPDDSMVASCSLDNTVRIWDTLRGTLLTVLQEHTSFVKGVVWDPVGKYIASQSDDRSVVIRTVEGWETVSVVKEPFVKAVWNTFSTRLDWCPDGSHITAVNTYQSPKNTAAILMRGSWKRTHDYIGHKGPVVASRFNPRLFRVESDDSPGEKYIASCIALGAQDNKVTVWLSRKARPVLVAKTFFQQSVVDLSWSPDGLTLFAASIDGSIAMFAFEESELGERLSGKEVQDIMKSSYGTARACTGIAEDPALMELLSEEENSMMNLGSSPLKSRNTPEKGADPKELPAKDPKKVSKKPTATPSPRHKVMKENVNKANGVMERTVIQHEARSSDGRRRIAPVPMGAGAIQRSPLKKKGNQFVDGANNVAGLSKSGANANGVHPAASPSKRKSANQDGTQGKKSRGHTAVMRRGDFGDRANSHLALPSTSAAIVFPKPPSRTRFSVRISSARLEDVIVEVQNVERDITGMPKIVSSWCDVICTKGQKKVWVDKHLGTKAQLACGCESFLAVALDKGILQLYSKHGRRMWPPMSLGGDISFLECRRVPCPSGEGVSVKEGDLGVERTSLLLLAVTVEGKLHLWDIEKESCILTSDVCPVAIGEGARQVRLVKLSESGDPLVVLDNRHALVYSGKLKAWCRVADGSHLFSEYSRSLRASGGDEVSQLNAEATSATTSNVGGIASSLLSSTVEEQRRATGRHLEFLTGASLHLRGKRAYCGHLQKMCRHMAQEAQEGQLREICDQLLQGGSGGEADTQENACILGIPKRKILKTIVLPAIASVRNMQRLVSEYIDLMTSS